VVSQENVEIVRLANAFAGISDHHAAFRFFDPAIERVLAREQPDARTVSGHEALTAYQREWQETLSDVRVAYERVLDAGDKVVAIGVVGGTGSGSGVDVGVPIAFLVTVRDGLITRVQEYLDPAHALTAAGLDE
jgi:ketosteroid isomerase-like protein